MKKLLSFLSVTQHTGPKVDTSGLEREKATILEQINKATDAANPIDIYNGWELMANVEKAIAAANRTNGKFSNLY